MAGSCKTQKKNFNFFLRLADGIVVKSCIIYVTNYLQTDNHTSTKSLNFYRPDALPDAQPTMSNHVRQVIKCIN